MFIKLYSQTASFFGRQTKRVCPNHRSVMGVVRGRKEMLVEGNPYLQIQRLCRLLSDNKELTTKYFFNFYNVLTARTVSKGIVLMKYLFFGSN